MKKKIFVDGRVFDTEYQGTRTYIQNIYNIIDKLGDFEIFIASLNPENAASFFSGSQNTKFISYNSNSKIHRALIDTPSLARKYKIDIAHFQYVISPLKEIPQIVTIHDLLFKDFPDEFSLSYKLIKNTLFYFSAKKSAIVTTVSEYSKLAINRHFNIPLDNIHVVPNGVGNFYFKPYEKKEAQAEVYQKLGIKNYLLYVSRIEPRKNQVDLLKAYLDLELYKHGKSLVFIGKCSIPVVDLNTIMNGLPEDIKKHIYFLENIPDNDLRLIYQAADLFIYPSKAEGFGIPPLEAGALMIPTICSNSTAMAEFSFFGANHIAPELPLLKEAIILNAESSLTPESLRDISTYIKNNYSWETAAEKLNQLIFDYFRRNN